MIRLSDTFYQLKWAIQSVGLLLSVFALGTVFRTVLTQAYNAGDWFGTSVNVAQKPSAQTTKTQKQLHFEVFKWTV